MINDAAWFGPRVGWEGEFVQCNGTLYYGWDYKYNAKTVSGRINCDNANLGDSAPGLRKECRCKPNAIV